MKKVAVIGSGVAGFSAAIHAQLEGFETELYEAHSRPGGMCTTWKRKGFTIDNCVHWFTCTKKDMQLNRLWQNVGLVSDDIDTVELKSFYSSELNGKTLTLWSDLERTRKELLSLSPEDEKEINDFIDTVELEKGMQLPVFKPVSAVGLFDLPEMIKTMHPMIKAIRHIGKENLAQYSQRFKNPLIKQTLKDLIPVYQYATSFIASYATVCSGNGDFIAGGTDEMIRRLTLKYESLGGKLFVNKKIVKVNFAGGTKGRKKVIESVEAEDGEVIEADCFIFACDPKITFGKLLDEKYMNKGLKKRYLRKEANPTFSGFHAAFAVDGKFEAPVETPAYFFETTEEFTAGTNTLHRIGVKTYHHYKADFAPEGKDIIQVHLKQFEKDYFFWERLAEKGDGKKAYREEKEKTAIFIQQQIEKRFPEYRGKLELLDVWTPYTYHRYTGAYTGSYMTFIKTPGSGANYIPNSIRGIKNGFCASNWLMSPGGLPCALAEGYFAVWYMMKSFRP